MQADMRSTRRMMRRGFPQRGAASFRSVLRGLALVASVLCFSGCAAVGGSSEGLRRTRLEASPQWRQEHFDNVLPRVDGSKWAMAWAWATAADANSTPDSAPPIQSRVRADFESPPPSGLRITWLGHSTLIVEIDGQRLLVDPVWGERCSPFTWIGPSRFHRPPLPWAELPAIDAVVISHDHYDHLDYPTILALRSEEVRFIVPLGVGAHLESWGIPQQRIVELDWWQQVNVGAITLTATPARHFSGRSPLMSDANQTLWAGWAMRGPKHAVFYSGDTALFPEFSAIGDRLGPFDVAMLENGAYDPLWRDVHLGPEQAVVAFQMLRAKLLLPVHWGTFNLALHGWTEPIQRLLDAAQRVGVPVVVPRLGEQIDPEAPPQVHPWWPRLPYQNAAQKLVMSSGLSPQLQAQVRAAHGLTAR